VRPILLARLIRADTLGASITMVLLGAATATRPLTAGSLPTLFVLAVSFHLYAYLLNDVVDLPIDMTDPRREGTPLVRGVVSPRTALTVALLQIPLMAGLVVLIDPKPGNAVVLVVLVGAVTIYDLWGKRCTVPPLTDLIQGVAWGSLGWLAAELIGDVTVRTQVLAVYFLAFILLANGVHGSIRDLDNDRWHGARTTATWFGARVGPGGAVVLGGEYLVYALVLQAVTVGLPFVSIVAGRIEKPGLAAVVAMAGSNLISTVLLVRAAVARDRHRQLVLGAWHLILVLAPIFVLLGPELPGWALITAVALYVGPFATYRWVFRPRPEAHWTVRSATRPVDGD